MSEDRYGRVKFATIQATKNELRQAIQAEGTPRIQGLWDRLEQWINSPPMQVSWAEVDHADPFFQLPCSAQEEPQP